MRLDASLPGRFATWTFRTFGRFDTRKFRYLPGRFATGWQKVLTVSQITKFQTGGETSWHRNVQM